MPMSHIPRLLALNIKDDAHVKKIEFDNGLNFWEPAKIQEKTEIEDFDVWGLIMQGSHESQQNVEIKPIYMPNLPRIMEFKVGQTLEKTMKLSQKRKNYQFKESKSAPMTPEKLPIEIENEQEPSPIVRDFNFLQKDLDKIAQEDKNNASKEYNIVEDHLKKIETAFRRKNEPILTLRAEELKALTEKYEQKKAHALSVLERARKQQQKPSDDESAVQKMKASIIRKKEAKLLNAFAYGSQPNSILKQDITAAEESYLNVHKNFADSFTPSKEENLQKAGEAAASIERNLLKDSLSGDLSEIIEDPLPAFKERKPIKKSKKKVNEPQTHLSRTDSIEKLPLETTDKSVLIETPILAHLNNVAQSIQGKMAAVTEQTNFQKLIPAIEEIEKVPLNDILKPKKKVPLNDILKPTNKKQKKSPPTILLSARKRGFQTKKSDISRAPSSDALKYKRVLDKPLVIKKKDALNNIMKQAQSEKTTVKPVVRAKSSPKQNGDVEDFWALPNYESKASSKRAWNLLRSNRRKSKFYIPPASPMDENNIILSTDNTEQIIPSDIIKGDQTWAVNDLTPNQVGVSESNSIPTATQLEHLDVIKIGAYNFDEKGLGVMVEPSTADAQDSESKLIESEAAQKLSVFYTHVMEQTEIELNVIAIKKTGPSDTIPNQERLTVEEKIDEELKKVLKPFKTKINNRLSENRSKTQKVTHIIHREIVEPKTAKIMFGHTMIKPKIPDILTKSKTPTKLPNINKEVKSGLQKAEEKAIDIKKIQLDNIQTDDSHLEPKDHIKKIKTALANIYTAFSTSKSPRERVQELNSLFSFYFTFRNDVNESFKEIIRPQLDFLSDPSPEVRLKVLQNLAAFNVCNDEILFAIIIALSDPNDNVAKQALSTISGLGISTKHDLQVAMIRLGLLRDETPEVKYDPLDFILRQRELNAANRGYDNDMIEKWRASINLNECHERPPSSYETLVPPVLDYQKPRGAKLRI